MKEAQTISCKLQVAKMSNRHMGIFTNSGSWEEYWKYEIAIPY